MSDLTATNCGCSTSDNGCCNLIWLILLLSCACGGNNGSFLSNGNGCGGNDSGCWIILLLLLCGGCGGNGIF